MKTFKVKQSRTPFFFKMTVGLVTVILILIACSSERKNGDLQVDRLKGNSRQLLIIVDGLRPDYVVPEIMPVLAALGDRGVVGMRSYAVYPSFTRPNRASISTGVHPGKHGVIHNTLYHPDLEAPVHSGRLNEMEKYAEISAGPMITSISIGELLDENGDRLLALGAGAWMLNHHAKGKGWRSASGHLQPEYEFIDTVGEAPESGPARTAWTIDLYLHDSLGDDPAEVVIMWLSETDQAGHSYGVGAPETLEAVRHVDEQIGRIVEKHIDHGLHDHVNIFITSDHGFTQSAGNLNATTLVGAAGLNEYAVAVRNMIYFESGNLEQIKQMVEILHRDENVGAVYTRPAITGSVEGMVTGTLSTDLIRWSHERSADIIFSPAWSDDKNEFGWRGTTTRSGSATHGSDSPYDLHIPLIAAGPDIKNGLKSYIPTGNIDFAPTLLHLQGIIPPSGMDGRVMHEILKGGPDPGSIAVQPYNYQVAATYPDNFRYITKLNMLRVDSTYYIRGAETERLN